MKKIVNKKLISLVILLLLAVPQFANAAFVNVLQGVTPTINGATRTYILPEPARLTSLNLNYTSSSAGTIKSYDANDAVVATQNVGIGGPSTLNGSLNSQTPVVKIIIQSVTTVNSFSVQGEWDRAPIAPLPPSGLSGVAGNAKVDLTWNHIAGQTYNVYMNGTKQNVSPLTTAAYTKTGLTNGTAYDFEVTAIADGLESIKSQKVTKTPVAPPDTDPPAPPTALVGSAGDTQVSLIWSASPSADTIGYNVYLGSTKKNNSPVTGTSYTVTGLTNGQAYSFTVRAVDGAGNESINSNQVTVTPTNAFTVSLIGNGTSVIVNVNGGSKPYTITIDGRTETTSTSPYYFTGLARSTDYVVLVEDSAAGTFTGSVNTGSTTSYVPPDMPDTQTLFQNMVNSFGLAATIAVAVIGGAISLGVLVILALWAWRLLKKWLASSK